MTKIDPDIAKPTQSQPSTDETGLSRTQLHESLSWLFGLIALVELGIILKLLMEAAR